jgi:SAM-dependent methyltransferase
MNYQLAYRIGFHPWEDAEDQETFRRTIFENVAQEEARYGAPFGAALDLGTGSGIWAVELGKRGWEVTGVDIVERALDRARERAGSERVDLRLVRADVTNLSDSGLRPGFRLVLDTGTFHGLRRREREAMGREVSAVAADDATVLLLGWTPRRRGPLPRGVSMADVESAFPGWAVQELGPTGFRAPKPIELLLAPNERWFRLRRGYSM